MKYLVILLLSILVSCNNETIIDSTRLFTQLETYEVNIIVNNQSENIIFETDSLILYYKDKDICKTFNTKNYYLDSVVLKGKLYTSYYTLYDGNIHIPIEKCMYDSINYIDVILYDECPWYSDSGNKILRSIQFGDADVADWIIK